MKLFISTSRGLFTYINDVCYFVHINPEREVTLIEFEKFYIPKLNEVNNLYLMINFNITTDDIFKYRRVHGL